MATPSDDGVGEYIRERFRELQSAFDHLAQRVADTTGDHAIRIAKLEMRADQTERALHEARDSHRWSVGTWLGALSAIAAIAAVIVAIVAIGQ